MIKTAVQAKNPTRRVAFALLLFLFGIYLFSASGHTYSPDEETILYVAQSFITRGEFNIPNPNRAPVVGGRRGLKGKIFSGTGVLTSLLVSPFYVVGDAAARLLEPRARDLLVRVIVVSLFNALIGALCGVVFFAWQRRMGISTRAALGVTLIAALGTMFWLYTRTLYAETLLAFCWLLAAYALRAFFDARASRWLAVAGLAAGLSILTKVQGALILPALAAYFAALAVEHGRRDFLKWRYALAFFGPLALCFGFLGYYNFIRFGVPFETGYGSVDADYPLWRGVYGQLLSSGKSVFLYAPPLVLSVVALPRFFKRYRPEALFCILLIATVILFHARVSYWAGDGAWGPRYLAATMMFWMLPLGAALQDWWRTLWQRALVLLFFACGVWVNLLGMTVNFDTYIQIEPREVVRHFEPSASPLLAQWDLVNERMRAWTNAVQAHEGIFLTRGFVNQEELFPQFIPPRAELWIKNATQLPGELHFAALDYRVETKPKRTLEFFANGAPLETIRVPRSDAGELEYRVQLPRGDMTVQVLTRGSEAKGKSLQGDELGVHVQEIELTLGENTFYPDGALAIPPVPLADAREVWGWFFRPTYAHWDYLAWYVNVAGLNDTTVKLLTGAWFLLAALCTTIGGIGLWKTR
ncbi:MAG: phospholipid carrier-dependent glycosyltransferase [Chloroflexota bacterium]|nr:MAG: phospholipid carrier-dependent glycosyltransferase [Chloroflexota bacterium]